MDVLIDIVGYGFLVIVTILSLIWTTDCRKLGNELYVCKNKECQEYYRGYEYTDFFDLIWEVENQLPSTIACPKCHTATETQKVEKELEWMKKATEFKVLNIIQLLKLYYERGKEYRVLNKQVEYLQKQLNELENIRSFQEYYKIKKPDELGESYKSIEQTLMKDLKLLESFIPYDSLKKTVKNMREELVMKTTTMDSFLEKLPESNLRKEALTKEEVMDEETYPCIRGYSITEKETTF